MSPSRSAWWNTSSNRGSPTASGIVKISDWDPLAQLLDREGELGLGRAKEHPHTEVPAGLAQVIAAGRFGGQLDLIPGRQALHQARRSSQPVAVRPHHLHR
jgi:hypothetical protein